MKMDAVFAVELLALVFGTMLYVKSFKPELTCCKRGVRIISYFVIIASFLLMINSGIGCYQHCKRSGWHKGGMGMGQMSGMSMMNPKMHEKMMKDCPMMKKMMDDMDNEDDSDDKPTDKMK